MLKCGIEFDNAIASPMSPKEFIEKYVFNKNVFCTFINKDHTEAHYDVYAEDRTIIMEIRMINLRQV